MRGAAQRVPLDFFVPLVFIGTRKSNVALNVLETFAGGNSDGNAGGVKRIGLIPIPFQSIAIPNCSFRPSDMRFYPQPRFGHVSRHLCCLHECVFMLCLQNGLAQAPSIGAWAQTSCKIFWIPGLCEKSVHILLID